MTDLETFVRGVWEGLPSEKRFSSKVTEEVFIEIEHNSQYLEQYQSFFEGSDNNHLNRTIGKLVKKSLDWKL